MVPNSVQYCKFIRRTQSIERAMINGDRFFKTRIPYDGESSLIVGEEGRKLREAPKKPIVKKVAPVPEVPKAVQEVPKAVQEVPKATKVYERRSVELYDKLFEIGMSRRLKTIIFSYYVRTFDAALVANFKVSKLYEGAISTDLVKFIAWYDRSCLYEFCSICDSVGIKLLTNSNNLFELNMSKALKILLTDYYCLKTGKQETELVENLEVSVLEETTHDYNLLIFVDKRNHDAYIELRILIKSAGFKPLP